MLETSCADRLRYHLVMKNRFPTTDACEEAIAYCWSKPRWGYHEVDVQPIYGSGWINDITKSQFIDGWDVENTHLDR